MTVNAATGRGDLGALNRASVVLNGAFFSPRLMASRLNLLNPKFYIDLEAPVRKEALKSLITFAGAGATILGLAKMGGVEVGVDPRSADFGKMKVGKTRFDMWGGFQQYIVLASRLISGQMVSSTTGREFNLGEGYKATTRLDIIQRFFESKTSPVASFALGLLKGKTTQGEDLNIPADIADRFIPMVAQDMFDLYKEKGAKGLAMAFPAIFGVGVQTYGDQIPMESKTKSGAPSIKWRQEPGLGETVINKLTGKQVSTIPEGKQEQLRQEREADITRQAEIDAAKKVLLETGKTQIVGDTKIYLEDGIVKTTKSETLLDSKNFYKEWKDLPEDEFKTKLAELKAGGDKEKNIAEQIQVYQRDDLAKSLGLQFEKKWSELNAGDKGNVLEDHLKWLGDREKVEFFKTMLDKDFLTDPLIKEVAKRGVLKPDDILKADIGSGVKSMVLYETLKAETGDFFKDAEDRQGALDELNTKTEERLKDAITKLDMSPREKQSQFDEIVKALKKYRVNDRARTVGLMDEDKDWSALDTNGKADVLVKFFTGMDKAQAEEKFSDFTEKGIISDELTEEFKYQWEKSKEENSEEISMGEGQKQNLYNEAMALVQKRAEGQATDRNFKLSPEEEQKVQTALAMKPENIDAPGTTATLASVNIGAGAAIGNNNPLNIKIGGATRHWIEEGLAVPGSMGKDGGQFIKFNDPETGLKAAKELMFESGVYSDLTVEEAGRKWSNKGYGAEAMGGVDGNKIMSSLSTDEKDRVIKAMALRESSTRLGEKIAENPPTLNQPQTTLLRSVASGKVSEEQATKKVLTEFNKTVAKDNPKLQDAAQQVAVVPPKVKYSNIGYIPPEFYNATSRIYGLIASLQILQQKWSGIAPNQVI